MRLTTGEGAEAQHTGESPEVSLNKGTLYIVSTPIGNPDDVTLRAIAVLGSVKVVIAEDGRLTGAMLERLDVRTDVCSLRPHRRCSLAAERLKSVLLGGDDAALVCDAGTPLIADPGNSIVRTALELQCRVIAVPGAVAAIAALTASGINAQRFTFDGFPPRTKADRQRFFFSLSAETRTIILYESRAYLSNTLKCLVAVLGDSRRAAVMRDLTRSTETAARGRLGDIAEQFGSEQPHGEYVLVIEGLKAD